MQHILQPASCAACARQARLCTAYEKAWDVWDELRCAERGLLRGLKPSSEPDATALAAAPAASPAAAPTAAPTAASSVAPPSSLPPASPAVHAFVDAYGAMQKELHDTQERLRKTEGQLEAARRRADGRADDSYDVIRMLQRALGEAARGLKCA